MQCAVMRSNLKCSVTRDYQTCWGQWGVGKCIYIIVSGGVRAHAQIEWELMEIKRNRASSTLCVSFLMLVMQATFEFKCFCRHQFQIISVGTRLHGLSAWHYQCFDLPWCKRVIPSVLKWWCKLQNHLCWWWTNQYLDEEFEMRRIINLNFRTSTTLWNLHQHFSTLGSTLLHQRWLTF